MKTMKRVAITLVFLLLPGGLLRSQESTNSVGMKMLTIPAGKFQMGQAIRNTDYRNPITVENDQGADWDELPIREVEISKPFEMSATEVTNAQFELFKPDHRAVTMKDVSRKISREDDAAAVNVSWEDAMRYCQWLSEKEKKHYRLPTEAEWEYACRAGTTTLFHCGDSLPDKYQQMSADFLLHMEIYFPDEQKAPPYYSFPKTISLQEKQHAPNAWGIYDMHGNAQEWCLDWYAPYNPEVTKDPLGVSGDSRVVRGGSFSKFARLLRSANRSSMIPGIRSVTTGFRVVAGDDMGEVEKPAPAPAPLVPLAAKPHLDSSYDPKAPLFGGPDEYVKIPPGLMGPLFSAHNHDPAVACLPNGDVFAVWYTCVQENGPEMAVACSRRKAGSKEWTPAELFFDTADMNDHAPALLVDGNTVFHFNKAGQGSFVRTSTDNGYTWTPFRPYCEMFQTGPNESNIQTRDGRLLGTLDGPRWTSIVMESKDHGNSWTMVTSHEGREHETPGNTGKAIAGIHTGMVELTNGNLLAFGRFDKAQFLKNYDCKLPMSLSADGGKTWTYSISEFPAVTSGQRISMKRLKEGPLLLCGFSDRLLAENAEEAARLGMNVYKGRSRAQDELDGIMVSDGKGGQIKGFGLYAALSWDDGKTWPVRRLITPEKPPANPVGTDGGSRKFDATHAEPNGYLAMAQDADGRINLISSRNHYQFNLAWLTQGTAYANRKL